MKTYARIDNGVVVEIILPVTWSEDIYQGGRDENGNPRGPLLHNQGDEIAIEDRFTAQFVATLVDITDMDPQPVEGWVDNDGVLEPYVAPPLTPQQILQRNQVTQANSLDTASRAMAPILVSLQLGDATDTETVQAKAWQAYYRALQAIDLTQENPEWPVVPESS